jgi:hypothetical protein
VQAWLNKLLDHDEYRKHLTTYCFHFVPTTK